MQISTDEEAKKKQQNMIAVAVIAAIIVCAIVGVFLCKDMFFSTPTVTVESVALSEITLQETTFTVNVLVENKNPVGATVTNLDIDLFWNYKGESYNIGNVHDDKFTIDANGNTSIPVPVSFKNTQMLPLVIAATTEDTFNITAKGGFDAQVLVFTSHVPVDENYLIENTMKDKIAGTFKTVLNMIFAMTGGNNAGNADDTGDDSQGGLLSEIMSKVKDYIQK
ncbi:MAG: LEA type 2 family protein [Methanomicrobium sp.]|nr:LEA type 2 family protein [Methanomicrobium sp.]